jgi:hypothetical protein
VLLRAEPIKQKTRRPEWRGITRAVSPKKIGERKKRMSKLKNVGEKAGPENGSARFEGRNRRRIGKSPMMGRGGPFPAITSGWLTIRPNCPDEMYFYLWRVSKGESDRVGRIIRKFGPLLDRLLNLPELWNRSAKMLSLAKTLICFIVSIPSLIRELAVSQESPVAIREVRCS